MMLSERRTIEVDLPEFVIHALLDRAAKANGSPTGSVGEVDLNNVIEWELVESITLQDVAVLEQAMPGFAAAVSAWLATATFDYD
jgi:hypothetical protein